MNLSDIRKAAPKRKKVFLSGRGRSSGLGKTCGVGGKGQWGRQGTSFRGYFEGGQMPLIRRLPKRGFNNNQFKTTYETLSLDVLEKAFNAGDTVDEKALRDKGLVRRHDPIKVTGSGKLTKKLTVKVDRFTETAAAAITKAGGTAEALNPAPPPKKKPETKPAAPASKPEAKGGKPEGKPKPPEEKK
jgi:large subunit ribosomal protein L15